MATKTPWFRAVRVSNSPAVESQRQEVRDLDRQLEELKQQRVELQVTLGVIARILNHSIRCAAFGLPPGNWISIVACSTPRHSRG